MLTVCEVTKSICGVTVLCAQNRVMLHLLVDTAIPVWGGGYRPFSAIIFVYLVVNLQFG